MKQVPSTIAGVGLIALWFSIAGCGGSTPAPTAAEPPVPSAVPTQPSNTTPTVPQATAPTVSAKPVPFAEPQEKIEPITPEYDLFLGRRFIDFHGKQHQIVSQTEEGFRSEFGSV